MGQVIHFYGASGSGTSTLGKALCERTGFFHMDSDFYFWTPTDPPFTVKRPVDERIELMEKEIDTHENVVITGSVCDRDWGNPLIPFFTLAFRVETASDIRLQRIKKRELERFGERIFPGGDMYETHMKFIKWAMAYDTGGVDMRSRAKHDEWEKFLTCPVIRIDGSEPVETNLKKILSYME